MNCSSHCSLAPAVCLTVLTDITNVSLSMQLKLGNTHILQSGKRLWLLRSLWKGERTFPEPNFLETPLFLTWDATSTIYRGMILGGFLADYNMVSCKFSKGNLHLRVYWSPTAICVLLGKTTIGILVYKDHRNHVQHPASYLLKPYLCRKPRQRSHSQKSYRKN